MSSFYEFLHGGKVESVAKDEDDVKTPISELGRRMAFTVPSRKL